MKKKFPCLYQDQHNQTKHNTKTSFYAIKKLHDTQIQLQAMRNRIKVLYTNDNKNNTKALIHQQKIDQLQTIRHQHLNQINKMNLTKYHHQKFIEELKSKNQIKKKLAKSRMEQIIDDITQQKSKQYLQICQQRQVIQNKIYQNRQKDLTNKQFRRNKIIQRQQQSKQAYHQFLQTKVQNIIKNNQWEAQKINKKRIEKEHQIQQMSHLQAQLLIKHSQSQTAFNTMKDKLNKMLGTIKVNHSSKQKQNTILKRSKISKSQYHKKQQNNQFIHRDLGVLNISITSNQIR